MADGYRREPDLVAETRAARRLVEFLRSSGLDGDEELVDATIEGECQFVEACSRVLSRMDEAEALVVGINVRIEQLQARRLRLREGLARDRAALAHAIEDVGRKRLPLPEALLSLTTIKPGLLVTDEATVPSRFFTEQTVTIRKLDRAALAEAVVDGERIEGAEKTNGGTSLVVRRR